MTIGKGNGNANDTIEKPNKIKDNKEFNKNVV